MSSLIRKTLGLVKVNKNKKATNYSEKIIKIAPLKALYIPIPKVACSSIKRVIANLLKIEIPLDGANIHRAEFPVVDKDSLCKYDDYWKFCFVRNPWDRLVSCYSEKIKPDKNFFGKTNSFENGVHKGFLKYGIFEANMPFEEFLKAVSEIPDCEAEQHFRSQHTFLTDKEGELIADFIGKFENIDQDFHYIFKRLNKPEIHLPKSNRTRHAKYREYYTDEALNIFEKRYSKDIQLFDYEF
ncbi:MAG: sulfotransferase family 2 domain-containing protein [Leptolyngbya sp. SIO1E4]|nr:sulfotransferase family 2 domain-containing protein [Leptolyngbya sp. SIO1E4]